MSLPTCLSDKNLVKFQISACPSLQRLLDAVQLGARRAAAAAAAGWQRWAPPLQPARSRLLDFCHSSPNPNLPPSLPNPHQATPTLP